MEKEQKSNWCFTCEFSVFARAYTGLQNNEEIAKEIAQNDQIWFLGERDQAMFVGEQDEFMTEKDVYYYWEDCVEIQPNYIMSNKVTVLTLAIWREGKVYELECDCVEPDRLLSEIMKIIYK